MELGGQRGGDEAGEKKEGEPGRDELDRTNLYTVGEISDQFLTSFPAVGMSWYSFSLKSWQETGS